MKKQKPKKPKPCLMLVAALLLCGCAVDPAYYAFVKAAELRQKAIGEEWLMYVQRDANKSPQQRTDAIAFNAAWVADIKANLARVGAK